jgi:predicted DsbA family dithiol-disulfide isomerase
MSQPDVSPVRMEVDFVADVVCPWCYIGWRRLKQALALRPGIASAIRWRPYQLNPELPDDGVDRKALMAAKFGDDPDRTRPMLERLNDQAASAGLELKFNEIEKAPNSNAAHRLIVWAEMEGKGEEAAEAVMRAYWTELRDIGDHQVLTDIAGQLGMDREAVARRLRDGAGKAFVNEACESAAASGVQGVPFMIFGGRVAVSGAHAPEQLVQAVDKAVELAA